MVANHQVTTKSQQNINKKKTLQQRFKFVLKTNDNSNNNGNDNDNDNKI